MSQTADREHFDMLPFIAILMCTLGCLLYVTLIVASLGIGPEAEEIWVFSYSKDQPRKTPMLLEWDGQAVTVHSNGRMERVLWEGLLKVHLADGSDNFADGGVDEASPLGRILADLSRKKDTCYALFAVRPSGFATFNLLADKFRQRGIDIGYEPIEENRPVSLLPAKARS